MLPQQRIKIGWLLFSLIVSDCCIWTICYPQTGTSLSHVPQLPSVRMERKFAEKPNSIKKASSMHNDLDDIQTNQISESSGMNGGNQGGFSWSNLLGMLMHMIFNNNPVATHQSPTKSENLDDVIVSPSPWAHLLTMGLKILSAILGGGGGGGGNSGSDGIDKVDNGGTPMQLITIIVNLLDALKTSFSHRSLAARHLGRKDSVSDAAVASLAMMKGYLKSVSTPEDSCMEKHVCEANHECIRIIDQGVYCHLGSYVTSLILDKTAFSSSTSFEMFEKAGRRGRSGDNCAQAYLECNEV